MNGKFVISLDYEMHWGIFDIMSVMDYHENLVNTQKSVEQTIDLSNQFGVRLTFATVGILFAENKDEIEGFIPNLKPSYSKKELDPYALLKTVGNDIETAPFHFAKNTISKIKSEKQHEIGTHTFSHYYCLEEGQTIDQFDHDLISAVKIAKSMGLELKSIVFPRNQVNDEYLKICCKNGITSYRGTEISAAYNPNKPLPGILKRGMRLLDSYLNILGHHTTPISEINYIPGECLNIPSSRFLRPYNKTFSAIQPLRIARIKKAMTHAAKKGDLFHLWWHPHNFGKHLDENMRDLKKIYLHFQELNEKYNFESETMTSLTNELGPT